MATENLGRIVGLSAYEVWINEGNSGTEQDFLDSLKGKDGTEVDLTGYATENFVTDKIAEAQLGGGEVDLSGYAKVEDVPTKTSELTNDSGFITADDIPETPNVPTKTSELTNDSGYITADDIPEIPTVPTKTSDLTNDSGYITSIPDEYVTETELTAKGYATESYVDEAVENVAGAEISDEKIAEAVQGWLDEHPEATTTVADGSITREKLNFYPLEGELSSNLVDETKLTSARFTNANGTQQTFEAGAAYSNTWRMTDYIDVSQHIGETISTLALQGYCFYNESKKAISGSGLGSGDVNKPADAPTQVVIPENVYYLKMVYWHNAKYQYQANYGEVKDVYTPYKAVVLPKNIVENKNIGEKITLDNIESEKLIQYTFSNDLIDYNAYTDNIRLNTSTGAVEEVASSLNNRLSDYIEVKPNTKYSYKALTVYSFRNDKSYVGSKGTSNYVGVNSFTTGENTTYVRVLYNRNGIDKQTVAYLVEGEKPDAISTERKHINPQDLKDFSTYSSVLRRMNHLFNPTVKTTIGFIGDSNTAGLVDNSYNYYEDCWANLLVKKITSMFEKDRYIRVTNAFVPINAGANYEDTCWFDTRDGFVNLNFYGTVCKVHYKGTASGVMVLQVDDGEAIEVDVSADGSYTLEGLTEADHFLRVTAKNNNKIRISGFTIHKYVEAVNRGVSGEYTRNLSSKNFNDDISVVVFGTNDRSATQPEDIKKNLIDYVERQHKLGNSVILVTPTPAVDDIETGENTYLNMAEVDSIIAQTCGYLNFEHISLYEHLLDYCDRTDTQLSTLFKDKLHITQPTHKIVYTYLCGKLGLGRDIEDYLTTT